MARLHHVSMVIGGPFSIARIATCKRKRVAQDVEAAVPQARPVGGRPTSPCANCWVEGEESATA